MNRLELVRALASEADVADTIASTVNQSGETARLVDWIDAAWLELQQKHERWNWMWEAATVTVPASTNVVAGTIPAARYDKTAYIGTADVDYLDWGDFRRTFREVGTGRPHTWTIRPDMAFVVDSAPTENTAFSVERWKNPTALVLDTDEPDMPAEYHRAIVHLALFKYCDWEEIGTRRLTNEEQYKKLIRRAENTCLSPMKMGNPLC